MNLEETGMCVPFGSIQQLEAGWNSLRETRVRILTVSHMLLDF